MTKHKHHHKKPTIGRRAAEFVLGIPKQEEEPPVELPQGYEINWTKNGHPYLVRTDENNPTDEDAANEHKRYHYSMQISRETLGQKFGVGIFLYFDFIIYLIWTNLALSVLGIVAFAYHAHTDPWVGSTVQKFYYIFYNDEAWAPVHDQWRNIGIAQIVLVFLFGPIYSTKAYLYMKKKDVEVSVDSVDYHLHQYAKLADEIKSNKDVSSANRYMRFFFSYLIFVIVLAASAFVEFLLLTISISGIAVDTIPQASLIVSAVIAIFIKAMNMIWQRVCVLLTRLERHDTWTHFRNHNTLKFFVFKMLNVLTMYASRILVPYICPLVPRFAQFCDRASINCDTRSIGVQLFFILIFDLTLQNLWELIYTQFKKAWAKKEGELGTRSNDHFRPQFDVAEEYMELFYRQYIIYLAFPIFPLVPILGLICNAVEYRVDKYRLLRICKHPKGMQGSTRNFLTFFLFATAAVALAGPPFGNAWVISGKASSLCPS
eukprot:TRINITY_DN3732_c0_g1_i1.p1 TRINITY_DN3732_c0_g1~~TRINITY_DN3732_c0_g1_i1.p1  ORF type:complete len:488 (+),score=77.10 TRINITY_DN3732_c0_g1_i1:189-1652(+)